MIVLIATIILGISFLGIIWILFRKIPVLLSLPVAPAKESFFFKRFQKIKKINPFKNFSYEIFLQKILSKIRILSLRAENKTSGWLQKLRQKSQNKKEKENNNDNYWEELKKVTKSKK